MKATAAFVAVLVASLGIFLLLPEIDLAASRLFYDPQLGFYLAGGPRWAAERSIPWLTGLIAAIVAIGAVRLAVTKAPLWRLDRKALVFVALAVVLGPGLVVNTLLKDHWGRARPDQTAAFGGSRLFTPAPLPALQCERNCSFVAGDAALGFSLVAFAFLLPHGRRRTVAVAATVAFGAVVGLGRVAAGRHFLSDVVFAGLIVFAMSRLLCSWIVERDGLGRPALMVWRRALGALDGRVWLWLAAVAAIEAIAIVWLDRPLATALREDGTALHPVFRAIDRLGLGYPYLILFGLAYAAMRWSAMLPPLRPWAAALRASARVPAFLFAAVAVSGLIVDLLKVAFGRTRPKLLFADGIYDFSWIGLRADHWSFPSGHAATAAALMTALWCLWPRPIALYVAIAALVATSRVVIGAHYLSDTVMGGFVAVLVTRFLAGIMLPERPTATPRGEAAKAATPALPPS